MNRALDDFARDFFQIYKGSSQQVSPRRPSIPSFTMMGTIIRAAKSVDRGACILLGSACFKVTGPQQFKKLNWVIPLWHSFSNNSNF